MTLIPVAESSRQATCHARKIESYAYDWFHGIDELEIPGRILSVSDDEAILRVGRIDFGGVVKEVNLALVPDANVGDYVVVHVGFALTKIDAEGLAARSRCSPPPVLPRRRPREICRRIP
jgi:hydrogenase expression/formation protein HypC